MILASQNVFQSLTFLSFSSLSSSLLSWRLWRPTWKALSSACSSKHHRYKLFRPHSLRYCNLTSQLPFYSENSGLHENGAVRVVRERQRGLGRVCICTRSSRPSPGPPSRSGPPATVDARACTTSTTAQPTLSCEPSSPTLRGSTRRARDRTEPHRADQHQGRLPPPSTGHGQAPLRR